MSSAYATRFEAVFLCVHPKGPKISVAKAAKYLRKSESFVRKWINRYEQFKHVDDLPGRGTKSKVTKQEVDEIIELFTKNPELSLRSGQKILEANNIKVSIMTIKRKLEENHIICSSTVIRASFTKNSSEEDEEKTHLEIEKE